MALADLVIEAYPIALKTKETILFDVIMEGTTIYLTVNDFRLLIFDTKKAADDAAKELNAAIEPTLKKLTETYEEAVKKIIER